MRRDANRHLHAFIEANRENPDGCWVWPGNPGACAHAVWLDVGGGVVFVLGDGLSRPEVICLVALSRGDLVREHNLWRFAHRFFSSATVNKLIAAGLAVRSGNIVRAA